MKRWAILILLTVAFVFSDKALFADGASSGRDDSSQKLNQVIQNQEKILRELDEIKSQLEVIKVRASNR